MKNLHFLVEVKLSICYNNHGYIPGLRGHDLARGVLWGLSLSLG